MDKDEKIELRAKLAAKKNSDNTEDLAARLRATWASLGSPQDGQADDRPSFAASPGEQEEELVEEKQVFQEVLAKSPRQPLLQPYLPSPPPSTRPLARLTSPLPEEHYALPTKGSHPRKKSA